VWVRDLEKQNANGTLAQLLAPSFGEQLSLKRLVANLKEISEPYDYTFQTLTSRELAAKRFRYKNKYPLLGERFGEPLTLYETLLKRKIPSIEKDPIWLTLIQSHNAKEFYSRAKYLTEVLVKRGPGITPFWRELSHLHTMGGFTLPATFETQKELVEKWVKGPFVPKLYGYESIFNYHFREGVEDFFRKMTWRDGVRKITRKEFADSPLLWATPGATTADTVKVNRQKVRSKNGTAVLFTSQDILEILEKRVYDRSINMVFQKMDETFGKTRMVANSDFRMYILMSYISAQFEGLVDHPNTTLFWSNNRRMEEYRKWVRELNFGSNLPGDYSEFDHRVSLKMIEIVTRCLKEWLSRVGIEWDEVDEGIWDEIIHRFYNGYCALEVGDKEALIRCDRGVLSGWRWTSLLDTAVNYGIYYIVKTQLLPEGERLFQEDSCCFQGDDAKLKLLRPKLAPLIVGFVNSMGFLMHPQKTWSSTNRDEFLRLVFEPDGIRGYPARTVRPIFVANPNKKPPPPGIARLRVLASNWVKLARRLGLGRDRIFDLMLRDLVKSKQLARQKILEWLETPASLGGFGLGQVGLYKFVESEVPSDPDPTVLQLPRIREELAAYHKAGVELSTREVVNHVNSFLGVDRSGSISQEKLELAPTTPFFKRVQLTVKRFFKWEFLGKNKILSAVAHNSIQDLSSLLASLKNGVSIVEKLYHKCSRSALKTLLTGKWHISAPPSLLYSDEAVSELADWVGGHVELGLISRHRIRPKHLDSARYYADITLQRMTPFGGIAYAW
jgi:hypothetical protein